jgi:hypothetical protein
MFSERSPRGRGQIFEGVRTRWRTPPCALLEEFIGGTEFAVNPMGTIDLCHSLLMFEVMTKNEESSSHKKCSLCDPTDPALKAAM